MFTYNCSGDRQSNWPHGFKFQIVMEVAKCAIFQSSPTICSIGVKGVREEPDKVQRERGSNFRGKRVSMMHCTVKLNCIGSRTVGILFCVDSRPPCYSKIIEMTNIIRWQDPNNFTDTQARRGALSRFVQTKLQQNWTQLTVIQILFVWLPNSAVH